jgi:hypothetical protein
MKRQVGTFLGSIIAPKRRKSMGVIDRLTVACYTLNHPDAGSHRARHSVAWRVCHFCDQFCAQCGNQYKRKTNDGQSVIFHVRDSSEEWRKMNNMNLDMEITKLGEEMTKCSKQCEGISKQTWSGHHPALSLLRTQRFW